MQSKANLAAADSAGGSGSVNLSIVESRGPVTFPDFLGERVYMREFRKRDGLPVDLRRWQTTVDQMLDGVDTDGPIYLMVDQAAVTAGKTHRRGGIHIDGFWVPSISAHGNPSPGHSMPERGRHQSPGRHMQAAGFHDGHRIAENMPTEGLILASTVQGCRGFAGEWDGEPGKGGDCSHIDLRALATVPMLAGRAYAGNVTFLHESLPMEWDCLRTVVRLNVPGWTP